MGISISGICFECQGHFFSQILIFFYHMFNCENFFYHASGMDISLVLHVKQYRTTTYLSKTVVVEENFEQNIHDLM